MKKIRKVFQVIFLISIIPLAYLLLGANTTESSGQTESIREFVWVPVFTAVISLLGIVSTSIFSYRQDKRDSKRTELELTKLNLEIREKEIELAKKQQELEELQKKNQPDGE